MTRRGGRPGRIPGGAARGGAEANGGGGGGEEPPPDRRMQGWYGPSTGTTTGGVAGRRLRGRGMARLMGGVPLDFAGGLAAVAGAGRHRRLPFALAYRTRGRCGVQPPRPCGNGAPGKPRR